MWNNFGTVPASDTNSRTTIARVRVDLLIIYSFLLSYLCSAYIRPLLQNLSLCEAEGLGLRR